MLTSNQIESELSLAYLLAVAAKAAFAVDMPRIDADSIDAIISAKGKLAPDGKVSPRIEVQLKATINWHINEQGNIPYQIPIKNYNDLRADTVVPRLLVVLCLPKEEENWLNHTPEALLIRQCAYYLNLNGLQDSVALEKPTVYLPETNKLSPEALKVLMLKASKMERP